MGSSLAKLIAGTLGGVVGVWALDRVTWRLWDLEPRALLAREEAARPGGEDPAHVMARRAGNAMGITLSEQRNAAGFAVHYALGAAPGALYGLARASSARPSLMRGALFGIALFVVQDELANTVMHTAGRPSDYPWQAHARGLIGHIAYGVTLEAALVAFDRMRGGGASADEAETPRAGSARTSFSSDGDLRA